MQLLQIRIFLSITVLSYAGGSQQSHSYSHQTNYQRQSLQAQSQPGQPPQQHRQQVQQQHVPQGRGQLQNIQQPVQNMQSHQRHQYGGGPQAQVPQSNPQFGQNAARMRDQQPPESFNQPESPIDEPIDYPDSSGGGSSGAHNVPPQELIDGINQLSEEIVEAVVERLEEDEAMAIELEKQGFDPNAYSSQQYLKPIPVLCIIIVLIILLA